jgi:hypothetical protein
MPRISLILLVLVATACGSVTDANGTVSIETRADRWDIPVELVSYEIPDVFEYVGEDPPVGFDSTAAHSLWESMIPTVGLVMANFESELVEGPGERAQHIQQACQGKTAAYHSAVTAFVSSSLWTVGAAFFRNVSAAWKGLVASGSALMAVNVARAEYNSCVYEKGREWDQAH